MIILISKKRLNQLKEAERKIKLVEMKTGTADQLIEKKSILERALNDVNLQLNRMMINYKNLKTANGKTLRQYKKIKNDNNRLKKA